MKYRGQYLITTLKSDISIPGFKQLSFEDYRIFYDRHLPMAHLSEGKRQIFILGYIYSYKSPYNTNKDIAADLLGMDSLPEFIDGYKSLMGHFIILIKQNEDIFLINDATGQFEIYHTGDLENFGCEPKILEEHLNIGSKQNLDYYQSQEFLKSKVYVGNTTHNANIKHFTPNHLINLSEKRIERYYPTDKRSPLSMEEASNRAAEILRGFMTALAHHHVCAITVTAGYDSRVILAASLEDKSSNHYFTTIKSNPDKNNLVDKEISQKISDELDFKLHFINEVKSFSDEEYKDYIASISYPMPTKKGETVEDSELIVSGTISEIARNFFGYYRRVTGKLLVRLMNYRQNPEIEKIYQQWIDTNEQSFHAADRNILDMFYWEEKMGNWAAKIKTERMALNRIIMSPFNCTELLDTLLSTERHYRDGHHNKLYDTLIEKLLGYKLKIPINPTKRQNVIRLMKRMKCYHLYHNVLIKFIQPLK